MADPTINTVTHAYDPTGTLPENYIENEVRELADRNVRAVVARFGAFFADTFVMRDANNQVVPRSKYQFCLYRSELSAKIGKEIVGGAILTDATVPSPVHLDYHLVGGPWGASNESILDIFYKLQTDDRPVYWANVLGKPDGYKPAHHYQDIGDLFGAEYWVAAMERATEAFLMGDNASHDEIWRRIDTVRTELLNTIQALDTSLRAYTDQKVAAFNTTIAAVDQRITTVRQELLNADAVIDGRITTVAAGLQANITSVNNALTTHTGNKNNPHEVTAAQVNAYTQAQVNALITTVNNSLTNYVKKNTAEDTSINVASGQLTAYVNGAWRVVWPPQWQ